MGTRNMKYLIALLSGFFVTLIAFVSGVGAAIFYLKAEPEPVRPLGTTASEPLTEGPVRVVVPNQHSPRGRTQTDQMASKPAAQEQHPADAARNGVEQTIDPITTAAMSPEPTADEASERSAAHVAWCSKRYRSYNPEDNRYNAYSGARRECVSPYSEANENSEPREQLTSAISASQGSSASTSSALMDSEHVQSCLERYRSYRPEDNTYQPYGGGPRRQCE